MQALCDYDAHGGRIREALDDLAAECEASAATLDHAKLLAHEFANRKSEIDAKIGSVLENWDLHRVDVVDRNVIRIATVELLLKEVPTKVVLDEAIEIGREFGSAKTPQFVNGVLDAVMKTTRTGPKDSQHGDI